MNKQKELKRATVGGTIAAVVIGFGSYSVGTLEEVEAIKSIQEMRPSLRFTCSAILTATTTILTLILTLLSFTKKADEQFEGSHYNRVHWIARLSTIAFIAGIFLLLLLNLPMDASKEQISGWYNWLYYGFLGYGALLGGLMVTIVLMLYQTAASIIILFHPDKEAESAIANEEVGQNKEEKESEKSLKQLFNEESRTTT